MIIINKTINNTCIYNTIGWEVAKDKVRKDFIPTCVSALYFWPPGKKHNFAF